MKRIQHIFLIIVISSVLYSCGGSSGSAGSGTSASNATSTNISHLNDELSVSDTPNTDYPETDAFYFSYDDSASTASRDLSVFNIQNNHLPDMAWGRPYEFLNAESFSHFNPEEAGPFSVSLGVIKTNINKLPLTQDSKLKLNQFEHQHIYALGVNISGPELTKEQRPNVVLTLLVDISGSMATSYADETRSDIQSLLDVTKHGLYSAYQSLKEGDVINIVTFSSEAETIVNDLLITGDDVNSRLEYIHAIEYLELLGSTNIEAGINLAYENALRSYDPTKANRVVIITDAFANTGQIDSEVIAQHTIINDLEGIHFAGIGVGDGFNEAFLNELTDIGKGPYSAMITPEDAERIFTNGFMRFIDNAVRDVRFKLIKPSNALHLQTAAEEVSENRNDVQSIHFSYNDSQFFLEMFSSLRSLDMEERFTLEISYRDESHRERTEIIEKSLAELLNTGEAQITSAILVSSLAHLISGNMGCNELTQTGILSLNDDDVSLVIDEYLIFSEYKNLISSYCGITE